MYTNTDRCCEQILTADQFYSRPVCIPTCGILAAAALLLLTLSPGPVAAEPNEFGQDQNIDVSGGFFSDKPADNGTGPPGSAAGSPGSAESAGAENKSMLPPPKNSRDARAFPLSPYEFLHVYDGLGEDFSSDTVDAKNLFFDETEQPKGRATTQLEIAKKVLELIKPKLDPFQQAQVELMERAQKAPKRDNSALKTRITPHLPEIEQKIKLARAGYTKKAEEINKKSAKERAAKKKEKPGIDAAKFGFDVTGSDGSEDSSGGQIAAKRPKSDFDTVTDSIEFNGTDGPAASVVSLYINVSPKDSADRAIDELVRLSKDRKVAIGNIVLVGLADQRAQEAIKKMSSGDTREPVTVPNRDRERQKPDKNKKGLPIKVPYETEIRTKYHLQEIGFVKVQELFKRLGVKFSPVWIVRSGGKDHVLEGRDSIWSMITKEGVFVGPDPLADQNIDSAKEGTDKQSGPKYRSPTTLESDPTPMVHYEAPGGGANFRMSHYSELRFGQ